LECFLKLFTARARLQIIAKAALPKYDFLSWELGNEIDSIGIHLYTRSPDSVFP
jgi:hypothetical protein